MGEENFRHAPSNGVKYLLTKSQNTERYIFGERAQCVTRDGAAARTPDDAN